ncbi:MAG: TorD/DmsD family molecular chaperone [Burkholderiales bacterium]
MAPEDGARADLYALISALFFSPPNAALLAAIARSDVVGPSSDSALGSAWRALQEASAGTAPETAAREFEQGFVSAGLARIPLHATYYTAKSGDQEPMVQLLHALGGLGIAKRAPVAETEDHLSALCDVMRLLVAGDAVRAPQALAVQREFFEQQLAPWYDTLRMAIAAAEDLRFYGAVAALMGEFFDLERQSFEIDD